MSVNGLSHAVGGKTLFKNLAFGIFQKDRIGLIGPNGAGKSTLLKILCKLIAPDDGQIVRRQGLRVGLLEQSPSFAPEQTIYDAVTEKLLDPHDDIALAYEWMSRLELADFPGDQLVRDLSGGWKKRVALARELASRPDVLFLDEPTNHLDVASILWLEEFLALSDFASVTVTHDRLFLQRTSTKIFDLDPRYAQNLLVIDGDYVKYLESKEILLKGQLQTEQAMKNTLRRETEWLRRGAKARQTKQKARIERAEELKGDVQDISQRNLTRKVKIDFGSPDSAPKKLIEAEGISKSFSKEGATPKVLFENLNVLVGAKTRLGLLGPNGSGKTTLIRILIGQEKSDTGFVKDADGLKVAYFEQNRDYLNPALSVHKNLCPEGDYVYYQGQYVYAKSYLERFLFKPEQMDLPVGKLSGGEQSRLRIAQIMLQAANVLILDEPTNDLDSATLEVLETALQTYPGAVILVTHDRYFLDQVSHEILAFPFSGDSAKLERFADYLQWETWFEGQKQKRKEEPEPEVGAVEKAKKQKLSFKEKHELEGMEAKILDLENAISDLEQQAADPKNMSNSQKLSELYSTLSEKKTGLDELYARWAILEKKN